jgi:hypothetical protein
VLKSNGVKATDTIDRMIDDGSRGWHDWYRLNWAHPPLWVAATRKPRDAKWRGPDGAALRFDVKCTTDNTLVVHVNTNAWGAAVPGQPPVDYSVVRELKGTPDWQTVTVELKELVAWDAKAVSPLPNWRGVTELSISPSGSAMKDGHKARVDGKPWQGPRDVRNLRWVGGTYPPGGTGDATTRPEDIEKSFNDAIKKSLEEEKKNKK